ncbi:hypothetical protein [Kitasatospora sp. NPDC088783]|uniref:hypothetical protein n=1 Tax=Kitasatospora sp. NPDC088783 TaxID=3364077 RepID=UPI00380E9E1D
MPTAGTALPRRTPRAVLDDPPPRGERPEIVFVAAPRPERSDIPDAAAQLTALAVRRQAARWRAGPPAGPCRA